MNTKTIRSRATPLTACVLLVLLSGNASASLGVISLEELTERAELIVYGRVSAIESVVSVRETRETSSGKMEISTAIVRIEPDRILKGCAADPLVVKAVENMEDSPRFRQDQEVILFLTQNANDPSYSTIGLIQGKFDVSDGLVVRAQTPVDQFVEELERLIP